MNTHILAVNDRVRNDLLNIAPILEMAREIGNICNQEATALDYRCHLNGINLDFAMQLKNLRADTRYNLELTDESKEQKHEQLHMNSVARLVGFIYSGNKELLKSPRKLQTIKTPQIYQAKRNIHSAFELACILENHNCISVMHYAQIEDIVAPAVHDINFVIKQLEILRFRMWYCMNYDLRQTKIIKKKPDTIKESEQINKELGIHNTEQLIRVIWLTNELKKVLNNIVTSIDNSLSYKKTQDQINLTNIKTNILSIGSPYKIYAWTTSLIQNTNLFILLIPVILAMLIINLLIRPLLYLLNRKELSNAIQKQIIHIYIVLNQKMQTSLTLLC